jgi:hypothetical protein
VKHQPEKLVLLLTRSRDDIRCSMACREAQAYAVDDIRNGTLTSVGGPKTTSLSVACPGTLGLNTWRNEFEDLQPEYL